MVIDHVSGVWPARSGRIWLSVLILGVCIIEKTSPFQLLYRKRHIAPVATF